MNSNHPLLSKGRICYHCQPTTRGHYWGREKKQRSKQGEWQSNRGGFQMRKCLLHSQQDTNTAFHMWTQLITSQGYGELRDSQIQKAVWLYMVAKGVITSLTSLQGRCKSRKGPKGPSHDSPKWFCNSPLLCGLAYRVHKGMCSQQFFLLQLWENQRTKAEKQMFQK